MKATIKRITLENFKGVKSATYDFDGKNVSVKGQNGAGKSTIFDAYMWVMADKDSELKSNPDIRPLGVEECTPSVEIVFDVDGKEVTVEKLQKKTEKESEENGKKITKVSLENSYKVNHSPMGLAQFKKKMDTYGFDFEKFLFPSHPDAFTSQMSAKKDMDKMRNTLFEMTSEKSDYEIACDTKGAQNVALMLENYTVDEIRNIQNDVLRKIKKEYGKDGEILRAKIEGMELSKEDIDTAELELQKNELKRKLDENKEKQTDSDNQFEELDKQTDGIMNLKFELNGIEQEANKELSQKKKELQSQIDEREEEVRKLKNSISTNETSIEIHERNIEDAEKKKQKLLDEWIEINEEEFNDETTICPTCKRELPKEEKEKLLNNFEKTKDKRLAEINEDGEKKKEEIKRLCDSLEKEKLLNEKYKKDLEKSSCELDKLKQELSELPDRIDISEREDVVEINRQIAEKEQAMKKCTSAKEIRQQLQDERDELQGQMDAVNEKLALAKKNVEIDEEIEKERKKQDEYEQNRANAQKILDQLDFVSKRKNELLSEEVNSHFKLVKFRLFDYLKNGTVVDDCTPIIDGKSINDHSNGALRVLAKLDIIDGLQKFYGQSYPVFVDDFSLVTDNTECRIDVGCQLIKLIAEKGVKELKFEVEG